MARPGDWSPLGLGGDPTPGDPEVVDGIVNYMKLIQTAATEADQGINNIMSGTGDGAFVGKTADWLREEIESKTKTFLAAVADAFETAAPAMSTYAQKLRDAQASADNALSQAQGLAEDDSRRETLKQQAEQAKSDLEGAATTASSAVDSVAHATNPWAKSACEQFWDAFFWIVLLITVVAIFVGGPLGLIAFALNVVLAVKEIVDFAQGNGSIGQLLLSLVGVLFPSTRALKLGDLVTSIKSATAAIAKGAWAGVKGLGNDLANIFRNLSWSGIAKNVTDLGNVVITSVKAGAAWIPKAVVGAGAFAHGLVALPKTSISAISSGFVNGLGKLAGAGITKINGAIDAFLKTKFVQLMRESLGGWQALRIFLPMAGHEIRGLGVLNAFKIGVLGRGLNISSFKNMTLIDKLGDTVQIVKGITMASGGVYDAWSKVMKPELITPGGSAGGLGQTPPALPRPIMEMPPIRQADVLSRMPDVDTSLLRGPNGDFGSVKIGNNTTIADLNSGTWHVNDANTSFSSTPSGIQVPNSAFSSLGDVGGADLRQFGSIDAIANAGAHVSTPGLGDVGAGLSKLVLPGNFGNVGNVGAGLGSVKIPGIAEGLGGAGAVGSLKAIGDLDVLTKVGNLNQLGDLNKVGGTAQITDGNVTLKGGDLRLVDGNGASISLTDLRITNGSGVSFDLNGLKLTDGVATVAPTGLRVDAGAGTGGMRFTDGAASVDVSKLQITHGNTSLGLTDLKFTNGTGTTFDLHSLKLSDGVNSVDLGANLRVVDSAGGSVAVNGGALNNIPVNGIGGLTDHLSTPGGLQSLLGLDQTAALHNMQSMFPGAAGANAGAGSVNPVSFSGGSFVGGSGSNAFGSIHNAKLHADLSDFAFRELPKIMDNEFQILKKTDESVQISLSDDAISHIGSNLGAGGAVKFGQAGPAPIEMPTVRTDGATLNAGPARQPVFETGGKFAEPQVARIETPGVNRVEDALAQLADVDVPRRVDAPDSVSAHTPDVDSAGSSLGPRPDLAGGEVTTPHVDSAVPLRDGQPLAVTPEGRVVDPAAGPGGARPESPSTIDSLPAPHWADDPLAEVKHLADRLFPNQADAVVTYQAAQGLLHQAQAVKAAGLQAGDGAHVAAQQVNDIVVAERLLAKAEENLAAQGLSGAQVDARMAELDAGDLKFAEAKVEIEIATKKQIDAVRGSADSPGPVPLRDDELFATPEAFDPKKALGLDEAQWRSLDKAQADLNFSNTKVDADTLRATLDSLGIDPADYQKFVQARDVGPSAVQAYKESGGLGAFGATDDQIRNALKQLPGDQRLVQALHDDPSFSDFREVFKGLWQDFAAKAGGDVDLAADRLKFVQWQSDPLRPGNLPPGLEASDVTRIFRDRDGAVSPGGGPKDLPAVPGRELDPPGGVSMDGLAKVWNDAVDKFRASVQNLEHSPGTNLEIQVMFDDTLREIAEGLPEAFARQARFEDELIGALPRFEDLVAGTKGNASWGNGIDDGVVDRARINYVSELRGTFDQTLRDLDIRFTGKGDDPTAAPIDPKLQAMRDELFGDAVTRPTPVQPYRGIGDYPSGLERFADPAALNKALTDDAFQNWSAKVDEIANGVPDRLRFENEAADTLDDAGRRFHDMADGADVEPKLLDAIGTDFREKLAVAFHDAYGAGGSRRGWLDHEHGHGDAFGGGRSAQADWRASQAAPTPPRPDSSSAAPNPGHSAADDINPGSSAGNLETPDNAGAFKVEPVPSVERLDVRGGDSSSVPEPRPAPEPVQEVVQVPRPEQAQAQDLVQVPRPAEVEPPAGVRTQVPKAENPFSSGQQLYANPAAAIEHDVAIFEVRFAEAGVPQAVSDSVLAGFRSQAEGLASIHQASGHSLETAVRAGVGYAGAGSAQVNLGLAYQQLLKTPQAWASFHTQVEITANVLETRAFAKIDGADLSHLSPGERMQVRIDALDTVADGVRNVLGKLYSTPGTVFARTDVAGTELRDLGLRLDGALDQLLVSPPRTPDLTLPSNAADIPQARVDAWAHDLLAHADARFEKLGDAPYRQELITQAQNDFTASLGRAVDDLHVLLNTHTTDASTFAQANVRLEQLHDDLLGQLRQGLADAHVTPLDPGQIRHDLATGRTSWGQAMIDSLPGSPALKQLEILSLDGRTVVRPIGADEVVPATRSGDLNGVLHVEPTATGQVPGLGQVADLIEALPPMLRPHDFVVHPSVPFTADELRIVLGTDSAATDVAAEMPTTGRVQELTDEELRGTFELKTFNSALAGAEDFTGWWKEQEFLAAAFVTGLAAGIRADLTELARSLVFRPGTNGQAVADPALRTRMDAQVVPVATALLGANVRVGETVPAELVQQVRAVTNAAVDVLGLRAPRPLGAKGAKGPEEFGGVLIQHPGYATGDQFGMLATLRHNPNAKLVVLQPSKLGPDAEDHAAADSILKFYRATGVGERVEVVGGHSMDEAKAAYKELFKAEKAAAPGKLLNEGVTFGTKYVAAHASKFGTEFKDALRIDQASMDARGPQIREWFQGKGIELTGDQDVLVVWSRFSGKKSQAHIEHDTSLTGVSQLLDRLAGGIPPGRQRVVVIAGDRHPSWGGPGAKPVTHYADMAAKFSQNPNFKVADITEFWKDPGSHHLIRPGHSQALGDFLTAESRVNQFGVYEFLHLNSNLQHLGFRSGNLEAFTLAGHRVTYLEENASVSTFRMTQWQDLGVNKAVNPPYDLNRVMSYPLMAMDQPPTLSGQLYKLDELALEPYRDKLGEAYKGLSAVTRLDVDAVRTAGDDELIKAITRFRDDLLQAPRNAPRFSAFQKLLDGLPGVHGPGEWLPAVRRIDAAQKSELAARLDDLANRLGSFRDGDGQWQHDPGRATFAGPEGPQATLEAMRGVEQLIRPLSELESTWVLGLRDRFLAKPDPNAWHNFKVEATRDADGVLFQKGFRDSDLVKITDRLQGNWESGLRSLSGPGPVTQDLPAGRMLGEVGETRTTFPELAPVNPRLALGGEYATNCVIAFITLNIALREGGRFQAPPSTMWSHTELAAFQRQQLGLDESAQPRVRTSASLEAISGAMLKAGNGAQAALVFDIPGQGFGHVVNVATRNDRVWFLDAQAGGPAVLPHGVEEFEFWPMSPRIGDPAGSRAVGPGQLTELPSLGARGDLKEGDRKASFVIMHPGFATGDQFGLIATLKYNENARVALGRPAPDGVDGWAFKSANQVAAAYQAAGVMNQVRILDVPSLGEFAGAVKDAFGKMKRHPLNFGTRYVAAFAPDFGTSFKQALKTDTDAMAARGPAIGQWFSEVKGVTLNPGDEVLVLWSRFSGKKSNAHLEHDTSLRGLEQLLDGLQRSAPDGKQRVVFIAGDRHPEWGPAGPKPANHYEVLASRYSTGDFRVVDLTEFWTDPGVKHLIDPAVSQSSHLTSDPRINQFGVYEFLHQQADLQHLGFRSGNLEAFTLSGHRVTYLEENLSLSTGRMRAWADLKVNPQVNPPYDQGRVMSYALMEMEQAPTRGGQLYKLDELALRTGADGTLDGDLNIMRVASDAHSGLTPIIRAFDAQQEPGEIAGLITRFRDELFQNRGGKQEASRFDQLRTALGDVDRTDNWQPDVKRLSPEQKIELARAFRDLANRLGWFRDETGAWRPDLGRAAFTEPSDLDVTVGIIRRVDGLIALLSGYRSAWVVKLRAEVLSNQGPAGWTALKKPFTPGFTETDLPAVLSRLENNWQTRGIAGTAGADLRVGRPLGDNAVVRANFRELAPVNPQVAKGGEYATNCVISFITLSIAMREGGFFQAPPSAMWSNTELAAYQRQQLGLADTAPPRVLRTDSLDEIRAVMLKAGNGAEAGLVFDLPGRGFGHVVTVATRADQVWFLDAQAGGAAVLPPGVNQFEFWPMSARIGDPAGSSAVAPGQLTELPSLGAKAQGLRARDKTAAMVIMHPGFATGDQFGIMATLAHNPNARVALGRPAADGPDGWAFGLAESVRRFYEATGVIDRVKVIDVANLGEFAGKVKEAFPGLKRQPVNHGTKYVAHFAEDFGTSFKQALKIDAEAMAGRGPAIGKWLQTKGVTLTADTEVLVLWSRFSGKKANAHLEHDTSLKGVEQLLDGLKDGFEGKRLVVIAGDRHPSWGSGGRKPANQYEIIGNRYGTGDFRVVDLTEFWNDPTGRHLIEPGPAHLTSDARVNQFGVYEFLHQQARLQHLGFRSGNLEAFVLSGHHVTYLEENLSLSSGRMQAWDDLKVNPAINPAHDPDRRMRYSLMAMEQAPTRGGQLYKLDELALRTDAEGRLDGDLTVMGGARDAHDGLREIIRAADEGRPAGEVAELIARFRDEPFQNRSGQQQVSRFEQFRRAFSDLDRSGDWRPQIVRLSRTQKIDLAIAADDLAGRLGWFGDGPGDWQPDLGRAAFTEPADLDTTLEVVRRLDELVEPLSDYRSGWLVKLRAQVLSEQGIEGWKALKQPFTPGFTGSDLEDVLGRVRANWAGRGPASGEELSSSSRPIGSTVGSTPSVGGSNPPVFEMQVFEPVEPVRVPPARAGDDVTPAVLDRARSQALMNGLESILDRLPTGLDELSAARGPLATQVVQKLVLDTLLGDAEATAFLASLDRVARLSEDGLLGAEMERLAARGAQSFDTALGQLGLQPRDALRGLAENLAWAPYVADRFEDALRAEGVDPQHERLVTRAAEQVEEQIDPRMLPGLENQDWVRLAAEAGAPLVPDLADALVLITMVRDLARLAAGHDAAVLTETTLDVVDRLIAQQTDTAARPAQLPAGFAERVDFPVSGGTVEPNYAFGPHGLADSFGGTGFTEAEFVAQATDFTTAPPPSVLGGLQDALTARIQELGATEAVRSMLEGGLDVAAGEHTLTLRLQDLDRAQATRVRPSQQPLLRFGEGVSGPMDMVVARSTAVSQAISRTGTFDASVWTSVTQGNMVLLPSGGISGSSTTSRVQGFGLDSASTGGIVTAGKQVYFDLPARLVSEVRITGQRAVRHRVAQSSPLRVAFPESLATHPTEPGSWITGSETRPLTGALDTVLPGLGPIGGLGFLNRSLLQKLSVGAGSDFARATGQRLTETAVRLEMPRLFGTSVPMPPLPWSKGRAVVTHAGAEVLAVRRMGEPVEVPVKLDKGAWSSQFGGQGNSGSFGLSVGMWVSPAPIGQFGPYAAVGFPLGTGRGASAQSGQAHGFADRVGISGRSVPYQMQVRFALAGETVSAGQVGVGKLAADLKSDLDVTVYVAEELAPAFERSLREFAAAPQPSQIPRTLSVQTPRYAPAALARPVGSAGFAGHLGLTGTQNLVRQLSGLLGQVQGSSKQPGQVRVDPWTRAQQLDLQDWLIERFGEPDLRHAQDVLFSEGGRSETYVRELDSGDFQHVTFEVSARRTSPVPSESIPVPDASVTLNPGSFSDHSHSGSDFSSTGVAVGSRWNWSVPIPGTGRKVVGRIAAGASAGRGRTDNTDVYHYGFVSKPLVYNGPAWVYQYPSELTLKVSVTRVLSRDLSSRIVQALETGARKLAHRLTPELEATTQGRFGTLAGWMVPEPFTTLENPLPAQAELTQLTQPAPPASPQAASAPEELQLERVDHRLRRFAAGTEPGTRTKPPTRPQVSWWKFDPGWVLSPTADPYGTVDIRPIDRVRHVGGVPAVRAALEEQLVKVGIDRTSARLWALNNVTLDHLRGVFLREASGQAGQVSQKKTFGDREAQYALVPVVHSVTDDGTKATFDTGILVEYSASATVSGSVTATFGMDANVRFGATGTSGTDAYGNPSGGGSHFRFGPAFSQSETLGESQALTRYPGQQLTMKLDHLGRVGAVRWRVIAVSSRNVTESGHADRHFGVRSAATDVDVADGIQFYAPERTTFTLADLQSGSVALPELRTGEPRLVRAEPPSGIQVQPLHPLRAGESERIVPVVPVSDTDPTLVPEYPLVPLNSVTENFTGKAGDAPLNRENPVLRSATELLAKHAPGALTGLWQLQTPGASVRGGLDVMLSPQALNTQAPVLRGGGLLLTRIDGKFLGQRVTQLLIRLNRDPGHRGYLTTEGLEGSVYSYNRGDERSGKSWSTTRTLTVAPGWTGIIDGIASPDYPQSQFIAELMRGWTRGSGGSYAFAPYRYDGFEASGDLSVLLGEVDVEITLISVWRPSPLLNTIGLGGPMALSRHAQKVTASTPAGTSAQVEQRVVRLGESVAVATADLIRPLPAATGEPIVSRVSPGTLPAGTTELRFSGAELLNKDVVLRVDPDKVRFFYDAWTKALEQHAGTPALLAAWGQIGQDEMRALSDAAVLENHLLHTGTGASAEQARLSVPIRSTGSVFTDTTAQLSVSFRLVAPKVSANFPAAQVTGRADVMTMNAAPGSRSDVAGSARGGAPNSWFTLNVDQKPLAETGGAAPFESAQPLVIGAPMYTGRTRLNAGGAQKAASSYDAWSLDTTWYGPVYLDALVTVTLKTTNQRDKLHYGGTELPLTFRVRNLVEAAYSPQRLLHDAGLGSWAGLPVPIKVPSGWYLPAEVAGPKSALDRKLHTVQLFPAVTDPRVAIVHTAFDAPAAPVPAGLDPVQPAPVQVRAYGQNLTPAAFAEHYLAPIAQHDPNVRIIMLLSDSLPTGTNVLTEIARAAGLPQGVTIVAVAGPLTTPFGEQRVARPESITADAPVHAAIDARNTWEMVNSGSSEVRTVQRSLTETLDVLLEGNVRLAPAALTDPADAGDTADKADTARLSTSPLMTGLGDVAMLRGKGPRVFEPARQEWLQARAGTAVTILNGLPAAERGELRDLASIVVGRASGHHSGLRTTSDPGAGLLRNHVVPITAALLREAAGSRAGVDANAVQAAEALAGTLVHALGLQVRQAGQQAFDVAEQAQRRSDRYGGIQQAARNLDSLDLGGLSEEIARTNPFGRRLAGAGHRVGRLLGDDAQVRVVFPEITTVNPGLTRGGEFTTNCVIAYITLSMALRDGEAFQAPPSEMWSHAELTNWQRQQLDTEKVFRTESLDAVRAAMLQAGEGAQAAMVFDVPGRSFGHVVNVATRQGQVWFLDAQAGGAAVLPHGVAELEFWPMSQGIPDLPQAQMISPNEMARLPEVGSLPAPVQDPALDLVADPADISAEPSEPAVLPEIRVTGWDAEMARFSQTPVVDSAAGDQTPAVPSAKALGKRPLHLDPLPAPEVLRIGAPGGAEWVFVSEPTDAAEAEATTTPASERTEEQETLDDAASVYEDALEEPEILDDAVSVYEDALEELDPAAESSASAAVSVPLGPDDLHTAALRERLGQFRDPALAAARGAWWSGLTEQAERLANNFEPVAVAPLSFVANSMVGNRLMVADGAADLSDQAREEIRSELSVVLLGALLQAWSAQGGTGMPTREMVRPVADLADDLIQVVFELGRPEPPRAEPWRAQPVVVEPVVIRPTGHITAVGDDVLGALLSGPPVVEKPLASEIPVGVATNGHAGSNGHTLSNGAEAPESTDPRSPADPTSPEPASSIASQPPAPVPPSDRPILSVHHRPVHPTPGLVAPIKIDVDDDRGETPLPSPVPSNIEASVADALALLAPGVEFPSRVTDDTHRWDSVGPVVKKVKDVKDVRAGNTESNAS